MDGGHETRGAKPVVLVVDDYQDCRDMYAAFLTLAGFRVLKAQDGLEAVETARRSMPDVILMDLSLPGVDGCEATRQLKANVLTRHIPVVALTAQALPRLDEMAAIGFESVIIKPCLPDDLAEQVDAIVRQAGHRERPR